MLHHAVRPSSLVQRTNSLFVCLNLVAIFFFLLAMLETMIFTLPSTSSLATSLVARLPQNLADSDVSESPTLPPSAPSAAPSAPPTTQQMLMSWIKRLRMAELILEPTLTPTPVQTHVSFALSTELKYKATAYPLSMLRLCRPLHNHQVTCLNDDTCAAPKCSNINFPYFNISFGPPRKRIKEFYRTRIDRVGYLKHLIDDMRLRFGPPLHNTIMLMTFNVGYSYMFLNWLCSTMVNHVNLTALRSSLLILATDAEARDLVNRTGFYTFDPEPLTLWVGRKFVKHAAPLFGLGSHMDMNMVTKFGLTNDIVDLGYNVASMDTDLVWTADAFDRMWSHCEVALCDAIFLWDGRPFGPARNYTARIDYRLDDPDPFFRKPILGKNSFPQFNTGFFLIKAGPRTAKLLATLMSVQFLQAWKGTDQLVYNLLLYHHVFSDLRLSIVPEREFVPGGTLHLGRHLRPFPKPPELQAIHASDAGKHTDKVIKLQRIGHWYFSPERCPKMFNTCRSMHGCLPSFDLVAAIKNVTLLNPIK